LRALALGGLLLVLSSFPVTWATKYTAFGARVLLPAVFLAGHPLAILLGGLFAAGSRDDVSASA